MTITYYLCLLFNIYLIILLYDVMIVGELKGKGRIGAVAFTINNSQHSTNDKIRATQSFLCRTCCERNLSVNEPALLGAAAINR